MDDHDRITVLETVQRLSEEQHERDIARLARNVSITVAVMTIVIPVLTAILLRP